jgi:hypothetical protein
MTVVLHHFLRGPMEVHPVKAEDGRREWFCPDRPMLRPMDDCEFNEKREQIDALLGAAETKADHDRDRWDRNLEDTCRGRW